MRPQPKNYIESLSKKIFGITPNPFVTSLYFSGESMQYVRFNQSKIRQSTFVDQGEIRMTLQSENQEATYQWDLRWDLNEDCDIAKAFIKSFQEETQWLDPNSEVYLNIGTQTSLTSKPSHQKPDLEIICQYLDQTKMDLVGLLATGNQWRASLNKAGQYHWFDSESHFFDYSLYTHDSERQNKALKDIYFSRDWDQAQFQSQVERIRHQLGYFQSKSLRIRPGKYRTFLAPAAMAELIGMLSWGALSYDSYKKGLSPFKKLGDQEVSLSPLFHLRENFDLGLQTPFNSVGEVSPPVLELISYGKLKTFLISSSSAAEYGVASNFADSGAWGKESLRSPELLPGSLSSNDILSELDTGLYLGNLHYCNWSDRSTARVTGMTRFGCFWVENGQIKAPIHDLRFDVSLFDIFGPNGLEALTQEVQIIPHTDTYHMRALGGLSTCGALIKEFACVL
jgi:predicted Zn-dependent protease